LADQLTIPNVFLSPSLKDHIASDTNIMMKGNDIVLRANSIVRLKAQYPFVIRSLLTFEEGRQQEQVFKVKKGEAIDFKVDAGFERSLSQTFPTTPVVAGPLGMDFTLLPFPLPPLFVPFNVDGYMVPGLGTAAFPQQQVQESVEEMPIEEQMEIVAENYDEIYAAEGIGEGLPDQIYGTQIEQSRLRYPGPSGFN